MPNEAPSYPKNLTKSWWDKKKNLLASAHKTGVGALALEAEQAYKKIGWSTFFFTTKLPQDSAAQVEVLEAHWNAVKTQYKKEVKPAIKALEALAKGAGAAMVVFKQAKVEATAGIKLAKEVAEEASRFAEAISMEGPFFSKLEEEHQNLFKVIAVTRVELLKKSLDLGRTLVNLRGSFNELRQGDLTEERWNETVAEHGRSILSGLSRDPLHKDAFDAWKGLKGFSWRDLGLHKLEDEVLRSKVEELQSEVNDIIKDMKNKYHIVDRIN